MSTANKGKIAQIIGVVVDVHFPENLPAIFNALETKMPNGEILTLEVQQHLGSNTVRTVAMNTTDGLQRDGEVIDTGKAISVPVGPNTLGRMFNVTGKVIDGLGEVKSDKTYPIHRLAPSFKQQSTKSEILANFKAATAFIERVEGSTGNDAKEVADGLISVIENAKFDKDSLEALLKEIAVDFTMEGVTKTAGDKFKADGSNVKISDTLAGGKVIVVSTPTDITKDSKLINPATTLSKVKAEIKDFVEWKGESSAEVEALETADVVTVCKEIKTMCQTITRYQSLQKNRESELERAKTAAKKAVDKFAKDAKGEGSGEQVTNAKGLSSGLIGFTTAMTKFLASGISYNQKLLSSMLNYCNDSLKNYKAS
jgi:hypothetical protein